MRFVATGVHTVGANIGMADWCTSSMRSPTGSHDPVGIFVGDAFIA
jgi:hypothetical protein